MKLWINGTSIGEFKLQSEYIHAISDFRKFFKITDSLYEADFDKMTPKEIATYVLAKDLVRSGNRELLEEAGRRQKYVRFFGDQFDNSHGILSLVKDEVLIFIIWYFKKKVDEVKSFEINLMDYKRAVSDFITWFNSNLAVFYPSYTP